MPGDVVDVSTCEIIQGPGPRYDDTKFDAYVTAYAARYADYFAERERVHAQVDAREVFNSLREELERKLALLVLRDRVGVPLYFGLAELPNRWLRVDFRNAAIDEVTEIPNAPRYSILAHAWQMAKVLNGSLSWEDFGLSFRVRLLRDPDRYDPLIHAFLTLHRGDLYRFCKMITDLEHRSDRLTVEAGGKTYTVNRFCPHNGGDLTESWIEDDRYLVCPRHRWCFDLRNGGACTSNNSSIFASESSVEEEATTRPAM